MQLCGPPSRWSRCCLLPSADPPGSGVRGAGHFPQDPTSGPCLDLVCVCVCVEAGPLLFHACAPHWGHLVMAPHGAG